MSKPTGIAQQVARPLSQLSALCDTGFALAVHIRFTRPSLLYRTYAADWIAHYSEKGYMLSDPVVRHGLANTGTVIWADLMADDPAGVIADAVAHGLNNGWNYATGPANSRTLCGLTKSGAAFTVDQMDLARVLVDQIHTLTDGIEHFAAAELDALRALDPLSGL